MFCIQKIINLKNATLIAILMKLKCSYYPIIEYNLNIEVDEELCNYNSMKLKEIRLHAIF
jgi:hypothetical protein